MIHNFHSNLCFHKISKSFFIGYDKIYFKDGYMYVTNSHLIIKLKIEDFSNFGSEEIMPADDKFLDLKYFKYIYKADDINFTQDCVCCISKKDKTIINHNIPWNDGSAAKDVYKIWHNYIKEGPDILNPTCRLPLKLMNDIYLSTGYSDWILYQTNNENAVLFKPATPGVGDIQAIVRINKY